METLRRSLYGMGMLCFQRPTAFLADHLVDGEFSAEWGRLLDQAGAPAASELLALDVFQSMTGPELLDRMNRDYTALFIGQRRTLAPPYASVYLHSRGLVMTRHTMEVKQHFDQWGLSLPGDWSAPPDHAALEWEFMHHLSDLTHQAEDEGNRDMISLLKSEQIWFLEHMEAWFPTFTKRIIEQPDSGVVYGQLAKLLNHWLLWDLSRLKREEIAVDS